jgi:outer membrane protein
MKKIVVSIMFAFALIVAQAQPEAGKVFLGGDIGVYSLSQKDKFDGTITDEQYTTFLTLLPKAGYFLSDKLAVGIQTGISSIIRKYPDSDPEKTSNTSFVFKPFGRYYLTTGTGGLFAEAGLGLSAGKTKIFYDAGTEESNQTAISIDFSPGVYYYITPSISLEAKFGVIGFSTEIQKDGDTKNVNNVFTFELFPSGIGFGVSFLL